MDDDADKERGQRYRAILEGQLEELLALRDATSTDRAPVTLDQQSVGRLSRIDAMQGQQMSMAADRNRTIHIARIREALRKIQAGEFGYCASCGLPIPDARLNADPSFPLCLECAKLATG